jgi:large subunit ribosomal protein L31
LKKTIHPEYKEAVVTCGCGNSFKTRSTRQKITVEVCSGCHPFFTGQQKFIDTAGRIEKFNRKWANYSSKILEKAKNPKAPKPS